MKKMTIWAVSILTAVFAFGKNADPVIASEDAVKMVWGLTMKNNYSPKTHLIYSCAPDQVIKSAKFKNGLLFYSKENGFGKGMENCAINNGLALSMLCDQYILSRDPNTPSLSTEIAEGLCNLASMHKYPGFIARGLCAEDGKSICALSCRGQVVHSIHALWRYYHSALVSDELLEKIPQIFQQVSDRMIKNVTPANDYNFLQADGSKDPTGICKMWKTDSYEMIILPMIYAATWELCRKDCYLDHYNKIIDQALDETLKIKTLPADKMNAIQNYSLLRINSALEILMNIEMNSKRKQKMADAMKIVAELAAKRAPFIKGSNGKCLCSCGEVALAQLMVPGFAYPQAQRTLLLQAILEQAPEKMSTCRGLHLAAAYWRARVKAIF